MRIIVVGAGCFGAWSAYCLAEAGHEVSLVDAFGLGNSRSSSGGETRISRAAYGPHEIYTAWSRRSLTRWRALAINARTKLFHETGVLSVGRENDPLLAATRQSLERAGVPHEALSRAELDRRWPQIDFGSLTLGVLEPAGGVLMARRAVAAVVARGVVLGVRYLIAALEAPHGRGRLDRVATRDGNSLSGDHFVFACGPWLPTLFPTLLAERIVSTRQEVFYFGPPAGDSRFSLARLPVWLDFGDEIYAIPDIEGRGVKLGLDRHGSVFDPNDGDRVARETVDEVRAHLARHFPSLAHAPIVGTEVCQYENTSNGDFLIDRHPELENVWLVGGGSGHGFKHGPAVANYLSQLITGDATPDRRFQLGTKEPVQHRTVY